ncbi:hypothetical protein [Candidatus Viadribacter manganicus]|uniref:Uncharacterized protein n=1 Tax=Candidatus Viadribacter manganicus TaxID=1759059 RepID=A0A1B1AJ13_9PROT|nr:hypothetical protein [Candidatus Viadribacter manganicus]ANP46547.1 hypothetical protein ATE48_11770 [Candidatus Viadribacter manganicus]
MIRSLAMACALVCLSAPALAQQQQPVVESCGVFQITDAEHVSYIPIPGFSILLGTPPFSAPPGSVHAVVCDRTSIFLGPNDHRVITDIGVPLFIRSGGRIAVLEIADRQLRLRFTQGQPTPQEQAAIGPAIEGALADIDRLPPRQSTP